MGNTEPSDRFLTALIQVSADDRETGPLPSGEPLRDNGNSGAGCSVTGFIFQEQQNQTQREKKTKPKCVAQCCLQDRNCCCLHDSETELQVHNTDPPLLCASTLPFVTQNYPGAVIEEVSKTHLCKHSIWLEAELAGTHTRTHSYDFPQLITMLFKLLLQRIQAAD